MNEKVDSANIIEVENPVANTKPLDSDEEEVPKKKNEEDQKYHESILNDVYNSMSDSEEDDEEESEKKVDQQIKEETKQKEEEIKKQQLQQSDLTTIISTQVKETVHKAVESAKAVQQDINVDKIKGMFNNAFTKFNAIVEKQKANLPELHIQEMLQEQKVHKSSLDDFLKKTKDEKTKKEAKSNPKSPLKFENFKIGEENNTEQSSEQEVEGEEFSDSEEVNNQSQDLLKIEKKAEENKNEESKSENEPQNEEVNWLEIFQKGKQADVTDIKLYEAKKEYDKNIIYSMVHSQDTRYLALMQGHLYSFQMIHQFPITTQQLKEINTEQVKKFATSFFQKSKEKLMQLKSGVQNQQSETPQNPEVQQHEKQQQQPQKKLANLKSVTKLQRLYMIDILEKGKSEIEVIMHFVNKQYNPMIGPQIKRYRMNLDYQTQEFLINLEREIQQNSQFYEKVKNAFHGNNNDLMIK